jgi:hypothetical protein
VLEEGFAGAGEPNLRRFAARILSNFSGASSSEPESSPALYMLHAFWWWVKPLLVSAPNPQGAGQKNMDEE